MIEFANSSLRVADLCQIQLGYNPRGRLQPTSASGRLAVQLRDFDVDGRLDATKLHRYDLPDVPDRYLVHPGDVVFRSRGAHTTAATVEGLSNPAIAILPLVILRPKIKALDPRFLAWAINQPAAQRHLDAGAQGQNLRMIPRPCLASLPLDLPDCRTQATIVMADSLATEEARMVARLATLKRQRIAAHLAAAARRPARFPEPA